MILQKINNKLLYKNSLKIFKRHFTFIYKRIQNISNTNLSIKVTGSVNLNIAQARAFNPIRKIYHDLIGYEYTNSENFSRTIIYGNLTNGSEFRCWGTNGVSITTLEIKIYYHKILLSKNPFYLLNDSEKKYYENQILKEYNFIISLYKKNEKKLLKDNHDKELLKKDNKLLQKDNEKLLQKDSIELLLKNPTILIVDEILDQIIDLSNPNRIGQKYSLAINKPITKKIEISFIENNSKEITKENNSKEITKENNSKENINTKEKIQEQFNRFNNAFPLTPLEKKIKQQSIEKSNFEKNNVIDKINNE